MSKKKINNDTVVEYDQEYFDEVSEYDTIEAVLEYQWDSLFEAESYMLVVGSRGTWRGRSTMVSTVIFSNQVEDFLSNLEIDQLSVKIYHDRVEFANSHHDGTNYYTVRPFSYNMLGVDSLKMLVKENGLDDDFRDYLNEVSPNERTYNCKKSHRVEYLENEEAIDILFGIEETDLIYTHLVKRPKWKGEA